MRPIDPRTACISLISCRRDPRASVGLSVGVSVGLSVGLSARLYCRRPSARGRRRQVMARLVDARAPLLPLGYRAGLLFCKEFGDWRRAMVLMEDMRVAKRRPSGESLPPPYVYLSRK